MKKPTEERQVDSTSFGVEEGAEIELGSADWKVVNPVVGSVLECHLGSSSIGLMEDEWFAVLVGAVTPDSHNGLVVEGEYLGTEDPNTVTFVRDRVTGGGLHLCVSQPCAPTPEVDGEAVHVMKVRCWRAANFPQDYVDEKGKKILGDVIRAEKKKLDAANKAKSKPTPSRKAKEAARKSRVRGEPKGPGRSAAPKRRKVGDVVEINSEESEKEDPEEHQLGAPDRKRLRELFNQAKEKMTGRGLGATMDVEGEALAGGTVPRPRGRVQEERRLVSGTNLRPGVMTPLAIEDQVVTRDGGTTSSRKKKRSRGSKDPGEQLLEQAAQAEESRSSRRKKKSRGEGKVMEILRKAVGGKKKKKKKKKGKKRSFHLGVKREPGDPDDSDDDDSDSSESSTSSSFDEEESKSDLSYEPPLRKKALTKPGSVMEDLIHHAQEQMDRGAMLDQESRRAGVTQGIKLSTYFALLIRPYYPTGNPLLRELYALAQAIDLLRMGRLAETADALASRFVAVHTAMSDGNWQTAAQLELFPLEQVQSASTSVMLQAQKHRRLLWKSQGFTSRNFRGKGGWWKSGGEEKGSEKGPGKGKKGKGKNKTKYGGGDGKGDHNVWKDNKEEPPKKT